MFNIFFFKLRKMKKIVVFVALLFFIIFPNKDVLGQPGCASVTITTNGGNNFALPCNQSCTTLTASAIQTSGETSTYSASSIPYSPPYAFNTGTPILVNVDDTWSGIINLPFTFCFYGASYNQIIAGSNGVISFDLTNAGGYCQWPFTATCPSSSLPTNAIFGVYHDIDPAVAGTMYYAILGSYPCRTFVVNWYNVAMFSSSCNYMLATHQIVLYETSNIIEVYIQNSPICSSWNSGNALVGIQDATGTNGIAAPGRNTSAWSASNEAWRFTPTGSSIVGITWFQGATQIGTGNSVNVCPSGTTTYTAQATYNTCFNVPVTVSDNITVSLASGNVVLGPANPAICSGGSIGLTASGSNTYTWTPATGLNQTTGSSVTASPPTTTTYTVTGITPGCTSTNSITVNVSAMPVISPPANITVCSGTAIPAGNITSTPAGATYTWTNSNSAIGLAASGTGQVPGFTASNSSSSAITGTITVTPAIGTCVGTPVTYTITVNPLPVISAPANITVCSGAAIPAGSIVSTPAGATYTWTNSNTAIGLAASGTGQVPGFTATNSTGTAITGTITITPAMGTCVGTPVTYTITVSSMPVISAPANITVCSGTAIPAGNITSTPAGATYTWTNSNSAIGLAASGTGQVPGFTASNSSSSAITGTITVTPAIGTCVGTPVTYTITVNPLPAITAPANIVICSGTTVPAGNIVSTPAGATYTWTNSNTAIGLAASGTGQVPGFTATNSTGTAITGTITITPAMGTCVGTPVSYTITVNPMPVISAPANITVCSGTAIPAGTIVSTPAGATYTWTNSNTAIGLAASGAGQVPGFTATNGTATAITGSITVTPTIGTCVGNPVNYTITATPLPTITAPANIIVCSGTAIPAGNIVSTPAGATYTWTNSNISIGLAASGTGQVPTFTATNATSTAITGSITVTPAIGACVGTPVTYTITVNPLPVITAPANITVCSGAAIPAGSITSTPSGATYTWTNSNTAIGLAASGTGQVPGFTATNTTSAVITGTITITPAIGTCVGTPVTYTITINPLPVIMAPANIIVCSGTAIPAGNIVSTPAGATYTWTNSNISIGLATSGTGQVPALTATNATSTAITGSITVTPAIGTCVGTPVTYTITVNPLPVITPPASINVCSGTAIPAGSIASTPAGATYSWTNSNNAIGLAASGTGQVPGFTANNAVTASITGTITVTPAIGTCVGIPVSYTITVKPIPSVTVPVSITICNGGVIAATSFTSPVAGATYTWTNSNTAIGLGASGSGNISGFNATNTTTDPITATVTVTPSANGCTGTSSTYTITVNPTPGVVVPANIHVCHGEAVPGSLFTSPTNGSTFAWTNSSTTIGLASSGTGNVPPFTASNTGTGPVVATITVTPTANTCAGTPSSYTITVNPLPVITFSPMPQLCHTSPAFTLAQASPPGGTYSGNGISGATFDPAIAGIGTHTVTYDYTNPVTGCSNSDTTQIVINGFLTITVTPNNPFVCDGNSVLLMSDGAYNFTWLPNTGLSSTTGSNVVATPVSTTTYTVSGTNPNGCMGSASVIVSVYNTPVLSVTSLPSEGCSPLDVTFGFAPLGPIDTNTLMWNFGDLSSADNTSVLTTPTHTFFNNGNYTIYLSALTTDGCPVSATDTVKAYLRPIADFYNNPIVGFSDNPKIDFIDLSTNAIAWDWNFGDPASYNNNNSYLQNPTHFYTDTGTFIVQLIVFSNQSCSDTVEKPVIIYPEIIIYIPNAFTPNDNGLNETFKPIMSGIDEAKYDFYIYDRWGRILFQTNDANAAWDGKYNGKDCELGVYVYFILYTSMTGEKFKLRGHVTIIR